MRDLDFILKSVSHLFRTCIFITFYKGKFANSYEQILL